MILGLVVGPTDWSVDFVRCDVPTVFCEQIVIATVIFDWLIISAIFMILVNNIFAAVAW